MPPYSYSFFVPHFYTIWVFYNKIHDMSIFFRNFLVFILSLKPILRHIFYRRGGHDITMDILSITLLSIALATDAFSVAVTDGMIIKKLRKRDALKIGLFFGFFQFLMPCIGAFLSGFASQYIEAVDHWIAFCLLTFLGTRMILESHSMHELPKNPLSNSALTVMAIATSIDALAAGITLSALNAPFLLSCTLIGITAFTLSFAGVFIGNRFGDFLGSKAETAGGIALILIGLKTLLEHIKP